MATSGITLGPFTLIEPIGRGGMADVWRAVHPAADVEVAVKIMTGENADNPAYRAGFRNEVRAVAALSHPNIVLIYDDGTVSADAQWLSKGSLRRNAPFIAMEYMAGGTLGDVLLDLDWAQVRRVLLLLLDALSHAHARGVVHLDLKPDNILLPGDHDIEHLKLTDFGIAYAMGRYDPRADSAPQGSSPDMPGAASEDDLEPAVPLMGTPVYMAPEQFAAQWRDFGPWTDLYALGCLAYEMVCGKPPFERANALQLAEAHWYATPPPLEPRFEIPSGFSSWIMRLLEKKPWNRFQFAADAAYALGAMEAPPDVDDDGDLEPDIVAVRTILPGTADALPGEVSDSKHQRSPRDHRGISRLITEPILVQPEVDSLWFERNGTAGEPHPVGAGPRVPPRDIASQNASWSVGTRQAADTVESSVPLRSGPDTENALQEITLAAAGGSEELAKLSIELPPIEVPPLPESWQPSINPPPSILLEGAGLGLFGLRTVPFVDRDQERDAIWQALIEVHQARRPAVALIHGSAGTGKSRLAEWIAERAHELGGARVLTAKHGPTQSPAHGLPAMLARFTRCVGLPRQKTARRMERLLGTLGVSDPYGWQALTEIMAPALLAKPDEHEGNDVQTVRFRNPTERYTAIAGYLEKLSQERPVIVWLDDAQWGGDSIRFVYHLVKHLSQDGLAVLFLVTAQDDALAERPYESGLLSQLKQLPGTRTIHVHPLPPEHHATLVRELLGLEPRLASRVESRTAGNPMFAVQLVGDWVQRHLLEPGENGFVLKKGVPLSLPDDIHQLWKTRVHRVLQGHPPSALHGLELAAALGQSVLVDEWRDACREAGIPFPEGVLDNLLAHRLVSISLGKRSGHAPQQILWTFAHAMLRESLERSAREAGRARRQHLACANMLRKRSPETTPGAFERIGRHYLAAGEIERALEPLLRAAERRREASDFHAARALVQRREEAIRTLGGSSLDVRLGDGWLLEAQMDLDQERPIAVARHITQLERAARHGAWSRLQASAKRLKGDLSRYHGDYVSAERFYQEALPQLVARQDSRETAHCLRGLANVAWERGLTARTVELYEKALSLYEEIGDSFRIVSCLIFLGHVAQQTGYPSRARDYFERAMSLGRSHGHLSGVSDALRGLGRVALYDDQDADKAISFLRQAKTIIDRIGGKHAIVFFLNEAGEIARFQGDLDRAERAYQKAEEKARDTRAAGVWAVPTLNLATVLLIRGQIDKACDLLATAPARLERQGHFRVLGAFHAALVRCQAERHAWADFDQNVTAARRLLTDVGEVREVDAWLIHTAAERCRSEGEMARADRASRLCTDLLKKLGRDDPTALDGTRVGHTL